MNQTTESPADERAAMISGLRALADLLENDPALPVPRYMAGTAFIGGGGSEQRLDAILSVAGRLGIEVTYDVDSGVCEASYALGAVRYDLRAYVGGSSKRPDRKIVVSSPSQILEAGAA